MVINHLLNGMILQVSRNKNMWKSNWIISLIRPGWKKSKLNHWNHQRHHLQGSLDSPTTSMFEGQPPPKKQAFFPTKTRVMLGIQPQICTPPPPQQNTSRSVTSPLIDVLVELVRRPSPKRHRSLLSLAKLRFVWTYWLAKDKYIDSQMVIWLVVEPTHLKKYARQNGNHFPRVRGENNKCLKTPPSNILVSYHSRK